MNLYENRRSCGWTFCLPHDPRLIRIWDLIGSSRLVFFGVFLTEVLSRSLFQMEKMLNLAQVLRNIWIRKDTRFYWTLQHEERKKPPEWKKGRARCVLCNLHASSLYSICIWNLFLSRDEWKCIMCWRCCVWFCLKQIWVRSLKKKPFFNLNSSKKKEMKKKKKQKKVELSTRCHLKS